MSEEEKRNYFLRLQRQKEEMESLLRALHPGPGREAVPVPEPEPEEEEQLYENTTMFAAKFIAEQQQQIGESFGTCISIHFTVQHECSWAESGHLASLF